MSMLDKGSLVYLLKTYCLRTISYGFENAVLGDNTTHKLNAMWSNCFRHILNCCWHKSVKPLQYFCNSSPMRYLTDQYKLLFLEKMYTSDNLIHVCNRFAAIGSSYVIYSMTKSGHTIKRLIWYICVVWCHLNVF